MSPPLRIAESQSIWLNLIRSVCSQGVLVGHCFYFFGIDAGYFNGLPSYCVLVFFVLSGFLISQSIDRKQHQSPEYKFRDYLASRFFRIYPPLIGSLIFVFILDITGAEIAGKFYSVESYIRNFFINLFLLQEFPLATFINEHHMIEMFRFPLFGTNLPFWTIAIEWWIYLFYGYVVLTVLKKKKPNVLQILIVLFLAITPVYYTFIGTRMEKGLPLYWFLGAVIMFLSKKAIDRGNLLRLTAAGPFILVSGLFLFPLIGYTLSIFVVASGIMLMMADQHPDKGSSITWLKNPARIAADYSYSLYLIHYPLIIFFFTVFTFEQNAFNFFLMVIIVNIIAYAFSRVFETISKKLSTSYENYRSRRD